MRICQVCQPFAKMPQRGHNIWQHLVNLANLTNICQDVGEKSIDVCENAHFRAVQKCVNRVDLETCYKFMQNENCTWKRSASIQPRTSPAKSFSEFS